MMKVCCYLTKENWLKKIEVIMFIIKFCCKVTFDVPFR